MVVWKGVSNQYMLIPVLEKHVDIHMMSVLAYFSKKVPNHIVHVSQNRVVKVHKLGCVACCLGLPPIENIWCIMKQIHGKAGSKLLR